MNGSNDRIGDLPEEVFNEMAREAGAAMPFRHRLRERSGVAKQGSRIAGITTENGARFEARIFADATYEGDVMAQANVSYTYGRALLSPIASL